MLNQQPIEKYVKSDGESLDVHSIFYTIQGEGPFSGRPALFIRLAGCNLQCPWCDTEYTEGRRQMDLHEIMAQVLSSPVSKFGLIVITGGEPFRQNIGPLLYELVMRSYYVQVETNGTLPPPNFRFNKDTSERYGAYIVCSPKAGKVNNRTAEVACCYKYVLDADHIDPSDGLPTTALGHTASPRVARPPLGGKPIFVQPADHKDEAANRRNIEAVVRACIERGYTAQVQLHKYLEVE